MDLLAISKRNTVGIYVDRFAHDLRRNGKFFDEFFCTVENENSSSQYERVQCFKNCVVELCEQRVYRSRLVDAAAYFNELSRTAAYSSI